MKEFWNERYGKPEFAYGIEPNLYFKEKLKELSPGKILLPAEGEGRNAVYAATLGWDVYAYDISEEGKVKADKLAKENGVSINYFVGTLDQLEFEPESFDCIALIFAHLPRSIRQEQHQVLQTLLKPGGTLIVEVFSEEQLEFSAKNPTAGGPKSAEFLFKTEDLETDFDLCEMIHLNQEVVSLEEGLYHIGESSVVRCLGKKKQ